jgi:hypothetical protein
MLSIVSSMLMPFVLVRFLPISFAILGLPILLEGSLLYTCNNVLPADVVSAVSAAVSQGRCGLAMLSPLGGRGIPLCLQTSRLLFGGGVPLHVSRVVRGLFVSYLQPLSILH